MKFIIQFRLSMFVVAQCNFRYIFGWVKFLGVVMTVKLWIRRFTPRLSINGQYQPWREGCFCLTQSHLFGFINTKQLCLPPVDLFDFLCYHYINQGMYNHCLNHSTIMCWHQRTVISQTSNPDIKCYTLLFFS